ncbi:hypothetical protein FE79_15065, partial [Staphylococcus aureus]
TGGRPGTRDLDQVRVARCSLRGTRDDADLRCQCPVHRAFVGDLHQLPALLVVERTVEVDHALELIDQPDLGLALGAVLRMDLA